MRKVLIIEDVATDVQRAGEVLASLGVKDIDVRRDIKMAVQDITSAIENGEALPATLLLDLSFNSESGFEILRLWHSNPKFKKSTKVIVWTQMGDTEHEICHAFGVKTVVSKWEGLPALKQALKESIEPSASTKPTH